MAEQVEEDVSDLLQSLKGRKLPAKNVHIDKCYPNTWNPNKMDPVTVDKLRAGILLVLKEAGHIPPIIVRKHPDKAKAYEIIDGYHRWMALKDIGADYIEAYVLDVSLPTAMTLTSTLNYLRGSADDDLYGQYLQDLASVEVIDLDYLGTYLPESRDEVEEILSSYDFDLTTIDVPVEAGDLVDQTPDLFMDLTFTVSASQAEIIEAEIRRISSTLEGRNLRGRALEYMAVQSGQTPMASVIGDDFSDDTEDDDFDDEPVTKLEKKAKRKKKKRKKKDIDE